MLMNSYREESNTYWYKNIFLTHSMQANLHHNSRTMALINICFFPPTKLGYSNEKFLCRFFKLNEGSVFQKTIASSELLVMFKKEQCNETFMLQILCNFCMEKLSINMMTRSQYSIEELFPGNHDKTKCKKFDSDFLK